MYHPRLYGEFYDMGFKYGSILHQKANFSLPKISQRKMDFGLASYGVLKDFYPEIIDEIKGFARGIKEKPENVAAFLLSLGIFDTSGQCSVFAFNNVDSVFVGRNYDMLYSLKKYTESSLIAPTGKFAHISQSDVFIGRSDGINEKGLSVAMAFVNGTKVRPGIGFHFVIRKILENCATTEEAIILIQETKVSSASNFLIADSTGDIAVIESAPQAKVIRRPSKNQKFIFITNQFISSKMKPYDQGNIVWSKSIERYYGLQHALEALDSIDFAKAKEILSNKCICLDLKKEKFGTIWSVVANLNELSIERAEKKPHPNRYNRDNRLNWWLNRKNRT